MFGFCHMLNVQINVLKDFVQIMRLDLMPQLGQQQGMKWNVQLMLRIAPSAIPIVPVGMAGILVYRTKILFFVSTNTSFSVIKIINNIIILQFIHILIARLRIT